MRRPVWHRMSRGDVTRIMCAIHVDGSTQGISAEHGPVAPQYVRSLLRFRSARGTRVLHQGPLCIEGPWCCKSHVCFKGIGRQRPTTCRLFQHCVWWRLHRQQQLCPAAGPYRYGSCCNSTCAVVCHVCLCIAIQPCRHIQSCLSVHDTAQRVRLY